jgi:hypothetical protein
MKISTEKAGFLENQKIFTKKRDISKKTNILLPNAKFSKDNSIIAQIQFEDEKVAVIEKEEILYQEGENSEIIKKRLILPEPETPVRKKRINKIGNTLKISSILMDEEFGDKDVIIRKHPKHFQSSKPITLKKISSMEKLDLSNKNEKVNTIVQKGSMTNLFSSQERENLKKNVKLFGADKNYYFASTNNLFPINKEVFKFEETVKDKPITNVKSSILNKKKQNVFSTDKWQKERSEYVIKNINEEFTRLMNVKSDIHKTFDSALAELYDKAINKTHKTKQRTAESHMSSTYK